MPLYEFKCGDCARIFEDLVRNAADAAQVRCPGCGSAAAQRMMSAPALAAGGSGGPGGFSSYSGGGEGGCGGSSGFS